MFACALALWWLEALALPLAPGRDFGTYLGSYAQLFQAHLVDLGYVLHRTPVAPLVMGGVLDVAGGALAEPAMSVLYAASVTAWFAAARTFSGVAGLGVALLLLLWPGYAILFHELSADAVFAAAFAGWSLLAVRALSSGGRPAPMAALGLGAGGLALIRPGNQALLVLVLLPLALPGPWRRRLAAALAFAAAMAAVLAGWTVHNGIRYGNYTFARGGNAAVPFFRAFVIDKIVRPDNGPASRELARAVARELLPKEPYRSYGITLEEFFRLASPRMQEDLVALSDRVKGWRSNHRWLREVALEAVRAHPGAYAGGVAVTVGELLTRGLYRPLPPVGSGASGHGQGPQATIVVAGRRLPKPTEGEPIPAPHEGGPATPDGSIYTVWTSPTEHHLVFVRPGDEARYRALHRRMGDLAARLPDRKGSRAVALRLNQASRWFPPAALWLVLGLVACCLRRPRGATSLAGPVAAAGVVILVTALGLPAQAHYALPVAPAFLLLAAAGLLALRGEQASAVGAAARLFFRLGAGALSLALLGWAVRGYVANVESRVSAGEPPHDLQVFLRASSRVLEGASPYAFRGDETYAYPPLLAYLAAPLEPLSMAAATAAWTLLSLAAVVAALWLLGVRDWRCYCLAAAYPATRSAVNLGTVGPLLLLAVAAAWRWRHRMAAPPAAAVAIAIKLFLWPLAAWLALGRRRWAGPAAAAMAAALILLPWAALGFAGLGGYPALLRRLADEEAWASYSVTALAVRAHLPQAVGLGLSLAAAAALLTGAWWVSRAGRGGERGREAATLTLALAAALASSPIVWLHYFLLLVVSVALARPRLSLVWLLPLAYWPLPQTGWPGGDPARLGLALVVTVTLVAAAVVPAVARSREGAEPLLRPLLEPLGVNERPMGEGRPADGPVGRAQP